MRRWPATVSFAAAVLLSLVVLFVPQPAGGGSVPHLDKVVHAALFALLVVTGAWRFGRLGFVLAAALVYALVSEVVQHVALPRRSGDLADVVADGVGALVAALLVRVAAGRRPRPGP